MQKRHSFKKQNLILLISIFIGLALGRLGLPWLNQGAEIIAETFLKLLRLISLPLVFVAVGSTITSIENIQTIFSLGKRILYYTLLTTIIASFIGLILFVVLQPKVPLEGESNLTSGNVGYINVLANILPENIFKPFLEGNVISIVFLAAILSFASLFTKDREKSFIRELFNSTFSMFLSLAKGVLKFLPIAAIAFAILVYRDMSNYSHLKSFSKYFICVIVSNLIQGIVVLPLLLKINRLSPLKTAMAMSPALITAFFSKSSATTLPLTMEVAEEQLHIHPKLSRFGFPLCSVINMNGCAAFILITTLFVGVSNGIEFSPFSMLVWVFIATLAAVGNAGVPMGCYFLTLSLLTSMKIPLSLLGFILPFYTIIDMIETALNVWSDSCVVCLANKQFHHI
ncbi:dicarboxylate/amino acid:cation symporter [Chlamydia pecorum]|uniref:Neutral amino acid transporter n=1 Tax=Chlamydia pecorum (strain ATCC VR-628 / DSM 29919 / E58) TaxID=331635 RepID=A0AA34RDQ3_CHLPE|nr:dicarboxylate/amino acid:cation symporter [Chlamydia pecorum]AEB41792.1 neutral amino acid transporter [Chlamydia pecorum E58]UFP06434.1 dicarboxylate/amino acid:cation symporter [Chlamydia pecorum]UJT77147.1 neutral amino acid transporter [Chlamydia pecorum]